MIKVDLNLSKDFATRKNFVTLNFLLRFPFTWQTFLPASFPSCRPEFENSNFDLELHSSWRNLCVAFSKLFEKEYRPPRGKLLNLPAKDELKLQE